MKAIIGLFLGALALFGAAFGIGQQKFGFSNPTITTLSVTASSTFTTALNVPYITDQQVYFSDRGTAAGDSGLIYTSSTDALVIGGTVSSTSLLIGNTASAGTVNGVYRINDISMSSSSAFAANSYYAGLFSRMTFAPTANASSKTFVSHDFRQLVSSGNAQPIGTLSNARYSLVHSGSGIVTNAYGNMLENTPIGPVTNLWGSKVSAYMLSTASVTTTKGVEITTGRIGAAGSTTNDYSMYITSPFRNSTMDAHYGIYLEDQAFGTTNYSIYATGTSPAFFGGALTVTGLSTLSAGQVVKTNTVTAGSSIGSTDYFVFVSSTAANNQILPAASSNSGRVYTIKDKAGNASSNNISVTCSGGCLIDGAVTSTMSSNYASRSFISDGSNWFIY